MPRHATMTTFRPGYIQPESMRQARSRTMKEQYAQGLRTSPSKRWDDSRRAAFRALAESGTFDRKPIGSRQIHRCGKLIYWKIKTGPGRKGWAYEHRHIMTRILRRKLSRTEHVHHKNGNTLDNRPENLEVMLGSAHTHHHLAGKRGCTHGRRLIQGWSRKYAACIGCGKTDSSYASKGYCHRCNERNRRKAA
jgi:HNH endonuclease